jgi:hypothetical protein
MLAVLAMVTSGVSLAKNGSIAVAIFSPDLQVSNICVKG